MEETNNTKPAGSLKKMEAERTEVQQLLHCMDVINNKEPEVHSALLHVIKHIAGTYADKYEDGEKYIITKKFLYSEHGAIINTYQTSRYIQRYITTGNRKSGLVMDLFKGIHYLLFEVTRRIKMSNRGELDLFEPRT